MARRSTTVTIDGIRSDEPGHRDCGKTFIITELSALEGEHWSSRLLTLVIESGVELPEGIDENSGASGVAQLTAQQIIGIAPLIALLQDPELDAATWKAIKYLHAPGHPPQPIAQGDQCQIEEIGTITRLRVEMLKMHTAFFSAGKASTSAPTSSATPTGLRPTRISRPRSVR
jgi:hypothetical protein